MTTKQVRGIYFEYLRNFLSEQFRDKIVDNLTSTAIGETMTEANILFALQMYNLGLQEGEMVAAKRMAE